MDELEQQYEEHMRKCNRYMDMIKRSVNKYGENAVANSLAEKLMQEEKKIDEVVRKIHETLDYENIDSGKEEGE